MVNKETIEYLIGKSIETIKCRKESYQLISLTNQIKATLNRFARETRTLPYEKGILIDNKGHIIVEKTDKSIEKVSLGKDDYLYDKIVDEYCKDIITQFEKERKELNQNPNTTYDEFDDFDDRYEKAINDRLNSLGEDIQIHIEHNHPGAYHIDGSDTNIPLDYNVFTCLSGADIKQIRVGINTSPYGSMAHNLCKSITADCSNGSRMTLINHNPVGQKMDFDKFDKASDNLHSTWREYMSSIQRVGQEYIDTFPVKYKDYKGNDLDKVMNDDMNKFLKKESQKMFPQMLGDVIKDFEEANCELRIDWL